MAHPFITFDERVVAWARDLGASIRVELLPWRSSGPEDPAAVSAALDLEGGPFDPDAVTAGLGVQPTISHRAGDYLPPRPRPMRQDRWRIHVGPRETLDMEAMLAELRARLGVPAEAVRRVCSELGIRPDVYCSVSPTSGLLTEIALSREVVGWASDLGASIGVNVMLWAEDEDDDCEADDDEPAWFAARHVLKNGPNYEERVTLWDAQSFEAAHELARPEAEEYVATALHDGVLLDLFQIYMLSDHPADGEDYPPAPGARVLWAPQGVEVFSLIRESELEPAEYLDLFFDTGYEFEGSRLQIFGAVRE